MRHRQLIEKAFAWIPLWFLERDLTVVDDGLRLSVTARVLVASDVMTPRLNVGHVSYGKSVV